MKKTLYMVYINHFQLSLSLEFILFHSIVNSIVKDRWQQFIYNENNTKTCPTAKVKSRSKVGILTKRLNQDHNSKAKLKIQLATRGQRWSNLRNIW
jgi:hypothetical protein